MARTTIEIGELFLAQADRGSAAGESGVFVLSVQFQGGMHLNGPTRRHHICFQLAAQPRFECSIGARLRQGRWRSAGIDCAADAEESVDAILVAIDPGHFALALDAQGASTHACYGWPASARRRVLLSADDDCSLARTSPSAGDLRHKFTFRVDVHRLGRGAGLDMH